MNIPKKLPFRTFHLLEILRFFQENSIPLDGLLRNYFREHTSIGSKDRKEICEKLYHLMRWRGLIDYFCKKPLTDEKRIEIIEKGFYPLNYQHDKKIPLHIRVSFPKEYFATLSHAFEEEELQKICLVSNERAPLTIRTNLLKISRDELFLRLEKKFSVIKSATCPTAIYFKESVNFFALDEFREGLFEVQDEGSQKIASLIQASPKEHVLDYCSGSGGKALAIAPSLEKKGQLYLHDIRPLALEQAKKRLARAGVENAQIFSPERLSCLKQKMDWVLVDAPCSGSGTLRRNPDMKWHFSTNTLPELVLKQREIFTKALSFLKEDGKIVYATCSIFKEENMEQVDFFEKNLPLTLAQPLTFFTPTSHGPDGFFAAIFTKKKS